MVKIDHRVFVIKLVGKTVIPSSRFRMCCHAYGCVDDAEASPRRPNIFFHVSRDTSIIAFYTQPVLLRRHSHRVFSPGNCDPIYSQWSSRHS